MPVLGLVRSPSRRARDRRLRARHRARRAGPHLGGLRQRRGRRRAYAKAVRTGRILVNAPTAVGALGGVYNSLTPTFSLGCGTWGGSTTTDNVNYRNLLNIKTVVPPAGAGAVVPGPCRTPTSTSGRWRACATVPARPLLIVTDADSEGARRGRRGPRPPRCAPRPCLRRTSSPSRTRPSPSRGRPARPCPSPT